MNNKAPLEISARHVHLSQKDFEILFGKRELKVKNRISQPGQFASEDSLDLINGNNEIKNVRVVGPIRKQTQIEISKTDAFKLGIEVPIRLSGDLSGTKGITLKNKDKKLVIKEGVIIAKRHLHISEVEAKKFNLKNNQKIKIKVSGERALVFDEVIVRAGKEHELAVHLDTDEGNAAGISKKMFGEILI